MTCLGLRLCGRICLLKCDEDLPPPPGLGLLDFNSFSLRRSFHVQDLANLGCCKEAPLFERRKKRREKCKETHLIAFGTRSVAGWRRSLMTRGDVWPPTMMIPAVVPLLWNIPPDAAIPSSIHHHCTPFLFLGPPLSLANGRPRPASALDPVAAASGPNTPPLLPAKFHFGEGSDDVNPVRHVKRRYGKEADMWSLGVIGHRNGWREKWGHQSHGGAFRERSIAEWHQRCHLMMQGGVPAAVQPPPLTILAPPLLL